MTHKQNLKEKDGPHPSVLLKDNEVIQRILDHIDNATTDIGDGTWQEPTDHYISPERFELELDSMRRQYTVYCPSASLVGTGSYVAREVYGVPIVVVRGADGCIKAFKNACRHRGVQVAEGCGRTKSFVCPYHAWTYGLDGSLKVVPHEHGFPNLDKSARGLVPIICKESNGLISICLQGDKEPSDVEMLANTSNLIPKDYRIHEEQNFELSANWKIVLESFLEGYHIRSTHTRTFYPVQYDNLNVVEKFGRHSRLSFPYRAIEKLRNQPVADWAIDTRVTYVYHLFPNIIISNHPGFKAVVILEPIAADRTKQITYIVTNVDAADTERNLLLDSALTIVNSGIDEDRKVIMSGQKGLAAGANKYLDFGLFESAIVHFHSTLSEALD
jgi:phenylpropionate dioxygenase-like ring-hydroxylating dioxygenase large terminal subunit